MTITCSIRSHRLAGDPDLNDAHIASCLRCQAEAARYRTLRRHLAELRNETVQAPPGFVPLVVSGLGTEADVPRKPGGIEAAVAAAGLAAVAGAVALWRRSLSA
jgi:anti-sigma factor RsiW